MAVLHTWSSASYDYRLHDERGEPRIERRISRSSDPWEATSTTAIAREMLCLAVVARWIPTSERLPGAGRGSVPFATRARPEDPCLGAYFSAEDLLMEIHIPDDKILSAALSVLTSKPDSSFRSKSPLEQAVQESRMRYGIRLPGGSTFDFVHRYRATAAAHRGALFSRCGDYRYLLGIQWANQQPLCAFVMLNPSTATEEENDPTVERCEKRARAWGFGGVVIANLFALRSADPRAIYQHRDPVGPLNDSCIQLAAEDAGAVVCAWGRHGCHLGRADQVLRLLSSIGARLSALKLNADGSPAHPLYLPYSLTPVPFGAEVAR